MKTGKKQIKGAAALGLSLAVLAAAFCVNTVKAEETPAADAAQGAQDPQTPQETPAPGPTAENDYQQGKVYKISPKSKPLKASKFAKSALYNKKTRAYFTIRSYMEKFQKSGKGTLILDRKSTRLNSSHMA